MGVLEEAVLVLNRNWQLVAVTHVEDAIAKLFTGIAVIIDAGYAEHDFESWIHQPMTERAVVTPSLRIPLPEVVRLERYGDVPRRGIKFSRVRILKRDRLTCQYCGSQLNLERLTIDHVLPKSRGGKSSWSNCVACCEGCNAKKADRLPQEASMKLRRPPGAPYDELAARIEGRTSKESWKPFLGQGQ